MGKKGFDYVGIRVFVLRGLSRENVFFGFCLEVFICLV